MVRKRTSRACVSPNDRSIFSCSAVKGRELSTTRSAPRSERAWSSIAWARLARNKPIAMRAATPNEIEMEKSKSRRRLERLSRQAMRGMKAILRFVLGIVPEGRASARPASTRRCRSTRSAKSWTCRSTSLRSANGFALGSSFDHLSVAQPDRSLGQACDLGIVRHEDERGPGGSVQFEHDLDDRLARLRVEIAGRFVGEQESLGRLIKARARATRCCSPPESCAG